MHLVVAVALTAPLLWTPGVPLGREPTATVPRFNLWSLRWTADRLPHGLRGWWDAPIFAPARGTYSWSEAQPLTGAAFALLRPIAGDERAYALLVIGALALNGIAGAALARRLGASRRAALLAGVLVQSIPFTWDQLGVLQLLALWPLLGAMASTVAWAEERRPAQAVAIGAFAAAGVATCGTLSAVGLVAVAPASLILVQRTWWRDPLRWAGAGLALGSALLLAGPLIAAQQAQLGDLRWQTETILGGSARPSDWWSGRTGPGPVLAVLGGVGLWTLRRRRAAWFVAATGATAAIASFGLRLRLGPLAPWAWGVEHLDVLARLRSPYRASAIAQVALAVLAAGLLDRLVRVRWGALAAVAAVALAVVAADPGPGPIVRAADPPGAWAAALEAEAAGSPGAVAFLPFAPDTSAAAFADTTERMLQGLGIGVPIVNGYSGFFPPGHADLRADLRGFPDARSLAALEARGARWAVVDADAWDAVDARAAAALGIEVVVADDDGVLLDLPAG